MTARAWTGRTDCTTASIEHRTVKDAERWIAERERIDPEGVERGDYFLDIETDETEPDATTTGEG